MTKLALSTGVLVLCMAAGVSAGVQRPTIAYDSMSVAEIGAQGFTFNLHLRISNPNDYAIPLGESTYALRFGDVPILQGRARPTGEIPAKGTLQLTFPVTLTWQNVLGAEEVIRRRGGDIPYTLEGQLGFDVNVPQLLIFSQPLRLPLRYSGVLPVRELLKDPLVLLRSPAAARIAQIALNLLMHPQTQPASPPPQPLPSNPPPRWQPLPPAVGNTSGDR
jgi:LEA14-like dessication related protein